MNILVTGASGFIAKKIIPKLREHNKVVTISRSKTFFKGVVSLQGNIFKLDLEEIIKSYFIDVVVHLAWDSGYDLNSDKHVFQIANHYRVLKDFNSIGVKKILAFGTLHEFGNYQGLVNSDIISKPINKYGISKSFLRDLTLELKYVTWVRTYYIYDNDPSAKSIFGKIIKSHRMKNNTIYIYNCNNEYDFLSIEDYTEQLKAIIYSKNNYNIVECCSGISTKFGDFVDFFVKKYNLEVNIVKTDCSDKKEISLNVDKSLISKILEEHKTNGKS